VSNPDGQGDYPAGGADAWGGHGLDECPVCFLSHGCDLLEGHPWELGHVCLLERCLFPDNGSDQGSRTCYCTDADDPECFT
jgi:hypothetical protein